MNGKRSILLGMFRHLSMDQDLRILNLTEPSILLLDDLVMHLVPEENLPEEMIYICLIHQIRHGRNYPMWAK